MKNDAIVIDVGSDKIRVANVAYTSSLLYVNAIKEVSILDKRVINETFEISAISDAIKECCQDLSQNTPLSSQVYINLPNPYLEMHNCWGVFESKNKKNVINEADIEKVVSNAKENIDLQDDRIIISQNVTRWVVDDAFSVANPLNMVGNRIEADVNFVSASKLSYQYIDKMLETLGFETRNIFPSILTLQDALLSDREKEVGVILIDIGSSFTNVIAYKNFQIVAIFTYPHGSRDISEELSSHFNISFQDAENIKFEHSCVYLPLVKKDYEIETKQIYTNNYIKINQLSLSTVCANRMMEIFISIKKKIKNIVNDLSIFESGVIITGGGSLHKGCKELAESIFKQSVNIGLPTFDSGLKDEFITPRYSNIIALSKKFEKDCLLSEKSEFDNDFLFINKQQGIKSKLKKFFGKFIHQNA